MLSLCYSSVSSLSGSTSSSRPSFNLFNFKLKAVKLKLNFMFLAVCFIGSMGTGNAQFKSPLQIDDVKPRGNNLPTLFLVNGTWLPACYGYRFRTNGVYNGAFCNGHGAVYQFISQSANQVIKDITCTSPNLWDCTADLIISSEDCWLPDKLTDLGCKSTTTTVFPWSTNRYPDSEGGGSAGWFGTSLYIPVGIIIAVVVGVVCCGINLSRRRARMQQAAGNRSQPGAPPTVLYVPPRPGAPDTAHLAYPRQPAASAMSPPSYDDVARLPASPPPPPPASSQGVPPPPSYESVVIREEDK